MRGNPPGAGKCRSPRHDYECTNFKSGHEGVFLADFFLESAWAGTFFSFFFVLLEKRFVFLFYMNLVGQDGTFKNIKKITQKR